MKPEEKAREKIDKLLQAAGWIIQDRDELNLGAALEQFRGFGEIIYLRIFNLRKNYLKFERNWNCKL